MSTSYYHPIYFTIYFTILSITIDGIIHLSRTSSIHPPLNLIQPLLPSTFLHIPLSLTRRLSTNCYTFMLSWGINCTVLQSLKIIWHTNRCTVTFGGNSWRIFSLVFDGSWSFVVLSFFLNIVGVILNDSRALMWLICYWIKNPTYWKAWVAATYTLFQEITLSLHFIQHVERICDNLQDMNAIECGTTMQKSTWGNDSCQFRQSASLEGSFNLVGHFHDIFMFLLAAWHFHSLSNFCPMVPMGLQGFQSFTLNLPLTLQLPLMTRRLLCGLNWVQEHWLGWQDTELLTYTWLKLLESWHCKITSRFSINTATFLVRWRIFWILIWRRRFVWEIVTIWCILP